jgi:hypothetical protein
MKLRLQEFKHKAIMGIDGLIDIYFSDAAIGERLMNATIKIVVRQNADKFDNIIELFTDKDGYIDTDMMIAEYTKAFGADKLILDLRNFVDNDMIKRSLPQKALAIKIEDISKMFEN